MLPEQIKNFREMVTLKDGTYVLLRPMIADDESRLMEFYSAVSDDDLRYFRHPVKEPAIVREWCELLDYTKVLPILALAKERVVGNASLHFCEGPKRHIGEVRLFLAKDYRKRGLGVKMLRALIDLARRQGLGVLMVEIVADETKAIKAFESLGFKVQATLDDYFMFPDGDSRDTVLMTMPLRLKTEEF
ncbi:MAG TPA: GNAT family N-acetyltransferase [Anaerolineales bacterium]|nr:GNAT family N-acetyltransferase [Anaerolineales bacterium]